jgi:hypothetical protein
MFLNDMEFGFEDRGIGLGLEKPQVYNWVQFIPLIAAGISAVGGIISGMAASSGATGGGTSGKIRDSTVSGNTTGAQDFLFDIGAVKAMQDFTTQMSEWSAQDREFFDNIYQPFQESLIDANQSMVEGIVANSGKALKSNLSDLFDSDMLKQSFKEGTRVTEFADKFADQIDKIPTADQRIGQAIAGVEQRFGSAGAELKRQMGAKGLDVSEAGVRELMIGKATAKAGAAEQAGELARREMLDATSQATGVFSDLQEGQAGLLKEEREFTQKSADLTPQIGGVKDVGSVGEAGMIEAQTTAAESGKQVGTTSEKKDVTFTQKGIVVPKFFDKDSGDIVTAGGESITDFQAEKAAQIQALGVESAAILKEDRQDLMDRTAPGQVPVTGSRPGEGH